MTVPELQEVVWEYYRANGRHDLPWRQLGPQDQIDPYRVVVSELMLQQTQVPRVVPKFQAFMEQFPSFAVLAAAPLSEVLQAWSGLGYNRRAKFLWQTAKAVVLEREGRLPTTVRELTALPGIGTNTAGAILAYSYNLPVTFLETNVRTVFIYHFFADQLTVHDRELLPLVEKAVPIHEAREWYWALMDYGRFLKQTIGNVSRASAGYAKQSPLEGSRRQIRGKVLKLLVLRPHGLAELTAAIPDERLNGVIEDLKREALIQQEAAVYRLAA